MIDMFILDIGKTWSFSFFRSLFAFLDYLIYSVIRILFKLMFQLANFELVGFYEEVLERIYVILGVFMLFKVTISLISYLVNPDKISDKEQGASKLVTRIITVLVMLIALPNAFSLLTEFQNVALPVIPKIVIGTSYENDSDAINKADSVAKSMTTTMINGFAHAKSECGVQDFESLEDFLANINETCSTSDKKIYAYDYIPIVSTIVGLLMCYVIVSLNISVAIRAFKLIILRMIAPIPVISYIDPKSSKDGTFATWVKTFISVWAELFMFLGIIYFIIYIIDFLLSSDAWAGFFTSSGVDIGETLTQPFGAHELVLFLAFIIIGLLFFAKQAPKFVMDALGIKSKGNFMRMLGMGATAATSIGGGISATGAAMKKSKDENGQLNPLAATSAVAKGLFSGAGSMAAGGGALLSSDKVTATTGMDAAKKYQAKDMNEIRSGYGIREKLIGGAKSIAGYNIDAEIQNAQSIVDTSDKLMGYAMGEGAKYYSDEVQRNLEFKYVDANGIEHTKKFDASRNQVLAAVSKARANGGPVIVEDAAGNVLADLGSVDGSAVAKITGDVNEGVGDLFLEDVHVNGYSKDKGGALKSLITSAANANGISMEAAEAKVVTSKNGKDNSIKVDKKKNENKVFNLKQEKGPSK